MKSPIGRLTLKAHRVIMDFADRDSQIPSNDIFLKIEAETGMGKNLLKTLSLDKESLLVKIDLGTLVKGAYYEAFRLKQPYVGTEHLLLALLKLNGVALYKAAQKKLSKLSIFPQIFMETTSNEDHKILDLFATNLNYAIAMDAGRRYIQRKEINALFSILLQRDCANPIIVGDSGVGKRTLVRSLVKRVNEMDVPAGLLGYRVYEVDLLALITTNLNKGDMEIMLSSLYAELKKMDRVLIVLKNFEDLFFSTNAGIAIPLIYNSFRSSLNDLGIKYVATISEDVYSHLLEENPRVLGGFSIIDMDEPAEDKSLQILNATAEYLEKHHNVYYSPEIVGYVLKKVSKRSMDVKFPQKGVTLLDQAGACVLLRKAQVPSEYKELLEKSILLTEDLDKSLEGSDYEGAIKIRNLISSIEKKMSLKESKMFGARRYRVTKKDVDQALEVFSDSTKEPLVQNTNSLKTLELRVLSRIVGQDKAVNLVSKALLRAQLGLRSKKRPLGNFLFLGPTGVGKTELAKVLSDEFFGEDRLIRLDMSDFGEKHTVARLVGAPPGYVGYGEGGELTSKIKKNPDSLVLFDEIEKAHPDVLNILLQITEEGELMDAKGAAFDFSSAVVVLTSNLGTEIVHRAGIGFESKFLNDTSLEKRLRSNLKRILKPELLNRMDEVVVFKRLNKQDQCRILDLMLNEVRENLRQQDISLRISQSTKEFLLGQGYSDAEGARALRRTVERELLDRIAEILLRQSERPLKLSVVGGDSGIVVRAI